jgi:drug/metabolite transporter (DMT)-like permease
MRIILMLVALGFMWGSSFALARYAMTSGVSPAFYTFCHILGPVVVVWLLNFTQARARFFALVKRHYHFFLVVALSGIALPDLNKFFLASHLSSGALGVIVNTVPLFIYPLAILAREEPFSWRRFVGVIVGVTGIMLLIGNGGDLDKLWWGQWHEWQIDRWAFLALFSPLLYAFCSVYIVRKRPPVSECSNAMLCLVMLFCAALLLLPLTFLQYRYDVLYTAMNWPIAGVILVEIGLTTVGYILLVEILQRAGSISYSTTDGIVAMTSLSWGVLFFGERISWYIGFGALLILIGIMVVMKRRR